MKLKLPGRDLSLGPALVMGVLNVTPDSFSDGGLWLDRDAAVKHALEMISDGAGLIDVGGESTRPGAEAVPEAEELKRVIGVIEDLSSATDVPISIDTRKPSVAAAAVAAGASIINDTAGEASDRAMDRVARESGAAIVIMHSRGTPATMRTLTDYEDVVRDVRAFLAGRADELVDMGVDPASIVLDPGVGFAKSPEQNLELMYRFEEFTDLGFPILSGTSRKSFIGAVLDLPEDQRVEGTITTVVLSVLKGARHRSGPRRGRQRAGAPDARRHHGSRPMTSDSIFVRRLRLPVRVGVTEEERARPQFVLLDLELRRDLAAAGETDNLNETVDYGAITSGVAALLQGTEVLLLERLAQEIAGFLLNQPGVVDVTVSVAKEDPPIEEEAAAVGVTIVRTRG